MCVSPSPHCRMKRPVYRLSLWNGGRNRECLSIGNRPRTWTGASGFGRRDRDRSRRRTRWQLTRPISCNIYGNQSSKRLHKRRNGIVSWQIVTDDKRISEWETGSTLPQGTRNLNGPAGSSPIKPLDRTGLWER